MAFQRDEVIFLALDTTLIAKQQAKIVEYTELSRQIGTNLKKCRSQLNTAWSAKEITYFNRIIDNLEKKDIQLTRQLEVLKRTIDQTTEEIMEEVESSREEQA